VFARRHSPTWAMSLALGEKNVKNPRPIEASQEIWGWSKHDRHKQLNILPGIHSSEWIPMEGSFWYNIPLGYAPLLWNN
jgi:hypothetical protein